MWNVCEKKVENIEMERREKETVSDKEKNRNKGTMELLRDHYRRRANNVSDV